MDLSTMWIHQLRKVHRQLSITIFSELLWGLSRRDVGMPRCLALPSIVLLIIHSWKVVKLIHRSFHTRYVNGHAKAHYEDNEQHSVCLDASLTAFW